MDPKRRTPDWSVTIMIAIVVASAFSTHSPVHATAMPLPMQSPDSQPVTLTLECVDSATIRFEIANVGSTDTALPFGHALANGRQYLIDDLNLRVKPSTGNSTDYHYWPRAYPVAIGGRLDQWFEALPARASYRMSAKAGDFFAFGRQASFPTEAELSLRWTMSAETPKSLFPLVYWTGTLISNHCTVPVVGNAAREPLDELKRAEAKWQASRTSPYQFKFQYACNGLIPPTPPGVQRGFVFRVNDEESRLLRTDGDAEPVAPDLVQYSSVERLFGFIRAAWGRHPSKMDVAYDPVRGYPTRVCVDPAANVSDDEFGFLVTDFKVLSNAAVPRR